jgi:hypothetical protein
MVETKNHDARNPPNGLLDEVAVFLKVSQRSVLNYQDWGLLKPVYFGKKRMYRWSDVEKLARTGVPRRSGRPAVEAR